MAALATTASAGVCLEPPASVRDANDCYAMPRLAGRGWSPQEASRQLKNCAGNKVGEISYVEPVVREDRIDYVDVPERDLSGRKVTGQNPRSNGGKTIVCGKAQVTFYLNYKRPEDEDEVETPPECALPPPPPLRPGVDTVADRLAAYEASGNVCPIDVEIFGPNGLETANTGDVRPVKHEWLAARYEGGSPTRLLVLLPEPKGPESNQKNPAAPLLIGAIVGAGLAAAAGQLARRPGSQEGASAGPQAASSAAKRIRIRPRPL